MESEQDLCNIGPHVAIELHDQRYLIEINKICDLQLQSDLIQQHQISFVGPFMLQ